MKRRSFRTLLCTLLAVCALTTFALADTGPKAQLIVRVANAPDEPYYLDLLAEGDWDESEAFNGIEWSYSDEEAAALDEALLALLRENIPDDWHACTAEGSLGVPMWGDLYPEEFENDGTAVHVFGYHGVPSTYRILMVTASGEVFLSDTLTREVLQTTATVRWNGAASTVSTPAPAASYALQFFATLLPTLLIEGIVLLLFGYSWKRSWKAFLLVNLVTQGLLSAFFAFEIVQNGAGFWTYYLFLLPAELVVLAIELYLYAGRGLLKEHSKKRAALYAVCANVASALLGYFLSAPVWRFVTTLV